MAAQKSKSAAPVAVEKSTMTEEKEDSGKMFCNFDVKTFTRGKKEKVAEFRTFGSAFKVFKEKVLGYRITAYSKKMDPVLQNEIFAAAFKFWSDACDLKFVQVSDDTAKINMSFTKRGFDGPGKVLGHAYYLRGIIQFDEAEHWTHQTYHGTNLLQVAVHEIGHSLGLDHSKVEDAIMYASYKGYDPNFALHEDDIKGIQTLYGAPK